MATGRALFRTDVNQPVQERPGRDDERTALVVIAPFHREPHDAAVFNVNARSSAKEPCDVRLPLERLRHPVRVPPLVCLGSRRPHRGTAASIEKLELDARRVNREAHQPAQRVDLADEMSLGRAAHRRVAWHVRHRVARERTEADAATEARGGVCRFDARVAGADYDHVEAAHRLLPDAESLEDMLQEIFARARAHDLVEPRARGLKIGQDELLRRGSGRGGLLR